MRTRSSLTSILLLSLLLTGCAGAVSTHTTSTPSATETAAEPTPDTTPAPTSAAESAGELIVTLDAIEYTQDGRTDVFALDQPGPLVALIEQLSGQPPVQEDIEDPWGMGDVYGTRFIWADVTLASLDHGQITATFFSPEVGGADIRTVEGARVGSPLDEVRALGGWGERDSDGDGAPDAINIGMRAVPETNSLSRPGEVGAEFIDLSLKEGRIDRISSPSNDFSDL